MSAEATAYVTALTECCDGAEVTCQQKALLWCLADHHNRSTRRCDPSKLLLAVESKLSLSSVKRALAYLEQHCVIEQIYPKAQGRGQYCSYVFLWIDNPDRLRAKLMELAKGVQGEPLFCVPERGSEGVQIEGKRGSEGVQGEQRNKEEPKNQIQPGTNGSAPASGADPRHVPIRTAIQAEHAHANAMPTDLVPWDGFEGQALQRWLKKFPAVTVEQAQQCVRNYYASDLNIAQRPAKFIPHLFDYWAGPLNQYGTPRHFDKDYQKQKRRSAEARFGMQ